MLARALVLGSSFVALACGGGGGSSATTPTAASTGGGSSSAAEQCLMVAGAKHTPKVDAPEKITAKHLLVTYRGSKRAAPTVTRTREEACLRADEALKKLQGGMPFAEAVRTYSEEPGAATREGTLGAIKKDDVVPAFGNAAFELERGEVSQVVESEFGFHVILRAE